MPEIRDANAEYIRAYTEKFELHKRQGHPEKAAAVAEVLRGFGVIVETPEPVADEDAPVKRGPGRPSTRTVKAAETAAE